MYRGGLDIISWPMFNEAAWFKTLSSINNKLDEQKAKDENARTFLQNTKIIMAKLKVSSFREKTHADHIIYIVSESQRVIFLERIPYINLIKKGF